MLYCTSFSLQPEISITPLRKGSGYNRKRLKLLTMLLEVNLFVKCKYSFYILLQTITVFARLSSITFQYTIHYQSLPKVIQALDNSNVLIYS